MIQNDDWELSRFRRGDWVEIRSEAEILSTLDDAGCLGGMPFMPEMLQYCGQKARVSAVAHKTCETAHKTYTGRRVSRAVHLEGLRCDGSYHGGCDAQCNLFWKDSWLKPAGSSPESESEGPCARSDGNRTMTSDELVLLTRKAASDEADEPAYSCQATELFEATKPLHWWDLRQYVRDVTTGNHSLRHVLAVLLLAGVRCIRDRTPRGYRLMSGLLDRLHTVLFGRPSPFVEGTVPRGQSTPARALNLTAGQRVRVRDLREIVETIDTASKNRGLTFDKEMAPYCGSEVRVKGRVRQIIDEETGKMLYMKSPCILLDGVVCQGKYSECRLLCPRQIYPFWREIWLEPLDPPASDEGRR